MENKELDIWFEIEEKDKVEFLKSCKENDYVWMGGKKIEPEKDICGCHMGVSADDGTLGYVGLHCWFMGKNTPRKIMFKDILGD